MERPYPQERRGMTNETAIRLIAAIDRLANVLADEVTKKEREKENTRLLSLVKRMTEKDLWTLV